MDLSRCIIVTLLAIERFKVTRGFPPPFMADIFVKHHDLNTSNISSNTRKISKFYKPVNPRTSKNGLDSLRCLGLKLWDILPDEIKNATSLSAFTTMIKKWESIKCPCKLCLAYVKNLWYLGV